MAATQVQIRRDTNAVLTTKTPQQGELAYDTNRKRMTIGDGSRAYGTPIASLADMQDQRFNAIAAAGTDTITMTFATELAPSAYATFQRFVFTAANDNTGTATLNVNSLGAKTIKKVVGGALSNLAAGDLQSGLIYEVMYDGTDFVLTTGGSQDNAITGDYVEATRPLAAGGSRSLTTTWTQVYDVYVGRAGTYNVRMRGDSDSAGTHYLQIYVDTAAEGTQRTYSAGSTTPHEEDITVERGQLIQLYGRAVSGTVNIGNPTFTVMSGNPYNSSFDRNDDGENN